MSTRLSAMRKKRRAAIEALRLCPQLIGQRGFITAAIEAKRQLATCLMRKLPNDQSQKRARKAHQFGAPAHGSTTCANSKRDSAGFAIPGFATRPEWTLSGRANLTGWQIDHDARPGRPHFAPDGGRLGKLRDDMVAVKAEVLAIQGQPADHDRLAVPGFDLFQPPVIRNRQRNARRYPDCKSGHVTPRVGWQKKLPGPAGVAAPDRRARREIQSEEFMRCGKPELVNGATVVENGAELVEGEVTGATRKTIDGLIFGKRAAPHRTTSSHWS